MNRMRLGGNMYAYFVIRVIFVQSEVIGVMSVSSCACMQLGGMMLVMSGFRQCGGTEQ